VYPYHFPGWQFLLNLRSLFLLFLEGLFRRADEFCCMKSSTCCVPKTCVVNHHPRRTVRHTLRKNGTTSKKSSCCPIKHLWLDSSVNNVSFYAKYACILGAVRPISKTTLGGTTGFIIKFWYFNVCLTCIVKNMLVWHGVDSNWAYVIDRDILLSYWCHWRWKWQNLHFYRHCHGHYAI
jgi:hypothetical protein